MLAPEEQAKKLFMDIFQPTQSWEEIKALQPKVIERLVEKIKNRKVIVR